MKIWLIFAMMLVLNAAAAHADPITIRLKDKVDELTTKSGVVYKDVTIREINKSGVRIMLSGGFKTIPAKELPQYKFLFDRIEEPVKKEALATPKAQLKPAWEPKSLDDVTEACLLVKITKHVNSLGQKTEGNGSAFLCNIGKATYIYSNVHNFFGTKEFYFEFKDGRRINPNEYAGVELASGKSGYFKKEGWGGDVIRIRLKRYYPKALTLDRTILTNEKDVGRDIVVTGNTRGRGEITQLEGKITSISDYDIIHHNAASQSGNSGSPIVDLNTFKVIGILTWGSYKEENPVAALWRKQPVETRESKASGASLARIRFSPSSFKTLYEERLILNRMKTHIRMLGLLDATVPEKRGLWVNKSMRVMGSYTVDDLLRDDPNHYIVKSLVALDKKLYRGGSKIGMSNQDVFTLYNNTYRGCVAYVARTRQQIEKRSSQHSFFFTCSLKNTELVRICKGYEDGILKSLAWLKRQRGTSGDALPLGKRLRLPSIETGLDGLGIKKE